MYEAKNVNSYIEYYAMQQFSAEDKKKNEFIAKVHKFKEIQSLEEAKEYWQMNFSDKNNMQHFLVSGVDCFITNTDDIFRICIDTTNEFISYEFI